MQYAWFRIIHYLGYRMKAGNAHGLHSPFVFRFYQDVWSDHTPFYIFPKIERERLRLLGDTSAVPQVDFGAGSSTSSSTKTLADITRVAASPPRKAQLLFRLANFYNCKKILELGSCVGLTTAYLAAVDTQASVDSFEGNPHLLNHAENLLKRLNLSNVTLHSGAFVDTLRPFLSQLAGQSIDLAYLDGHHQYEPTLAYFNQLMPHMAVDGILVFDDINWSPEMNRAWKEVIQDERLPVTVDLYDLGIVFLGVKCPKQHFVLR